MYVNARNIFLKNPPKKRKTIDIPKRKVQRFKEERRYQEKCNVHKTGGRNNNK
jgi:hypothetical protein